MAGLPRPLLSNTVPNARAGAAKGDSAEGPIELLDGTRLDRSPVGFRHARVTGALAGALIRALPESHLTLIAAPLRIDERTVLLPDVMVLRPRPDDYRDAPPHLGDVGLLAEVAEGGLRVDEGRKLTLYAAAAIFEVWIVDVSARVIRVHTQVGPTGYARREIFGARDSVSLPFNLGELALSGVFGST